MYKKTGFETGRQLIFIEKNWTTTKLKIAGRQLPKTTSSRYTTPPVQYVILIVVFRAGFDISTPVGFISVLFGSILPENGIFGSEISNESASRIHYRKYYFIRKYIYYFL